MSNILNLRKLMKTQSRICEILVELSKQHITQEEAIKKIDKYLDDNIVGRAEYKDLENIEKQNIRLKFENQDLKFNESIITKRCYTLKQENEELKQKLERLEKLEKFITWLNGTTFRKTDEVDKIFKKLKEVLVNEIER